MNVDSGCYYANDKLTPLIDLYRHFQSQHSEEVLAAVDSTIAAYEISKTNQAGYLALRTKYNETREPLLLYVLITNSFNHQIRFNSKGEFNMPFGKNRSCFNASMRENLRTFVDWLHTRKIHFTNLDFREWRDKLEGQFIYCDPPYLLADATYNMGWTEQDEKDLCEFLDYATTQGCQFALSSVSQHNQTTNFILQEWSKKYVVHELDWTYGNCSYHKKDKSKGVEVCITNASVLTS